MQIGGLQKLSLIDFPGKVATVVFTVGCNFRCPYCHNRELVEPTLFAELIPEEEIFAFLAERKEKIQGIVVSGGEPTLQKDLPVFLREVKRMGFSAKLDTNGSHPDVLAELINNNLVDFIAMDIKAPFDKYPSVAGLETNLEKIKESLKLIIACDVEHLFRTTLHKTYLLPEDIAEIAGMIPPGHKFLLQNFSFQQNVLDETLLDQPNYSEEEFEELREKWERE